MQFSKAEHFIEIIEAK